MPEVGIPFQELTHRALSNKLTLFMENHIFIHSKYQKSVIVLSKAPELVRGGTFFLFP